MGWLYHLNAGVTHGLEGFLETAVPMIAGLAEVIGLFIIVTSLIKATYHYVRATFFHDHHDFHHEMSSGLTTALEFLMSAEIAKTFLLQNLESVVPLAATFALRAMMSLMLHWETEDSEDLQHAFLIRYHLSDTLLTAVESDTDMVCSSSRLLMDFRLKYRITG